MRKTMTIATKLVIMLIVPSFPWHKRLAFTQAILEATDKAAKSALEWQINRLNCQTT